MNYQTEQKQYIVNDEFATIALSLIEKYPTVYHSVNIQKVCCVNLITTEPSTNERVWKLQKVKLPMALHCQYDWYVIFCSKDWDSWGEDKKKLIMVVDVLMCLNGMK